MIPYTTRIAPTAVSSELERVRLWRRLLVVIGSGTVLQVAQATGHHRETVRRYVAGQWPSTEFLAAVCRAYNVNGDWLLTGRATAPKPPSRARQAAESGVSPPTKQR